jgi:hypothetical protein
LTTKPSPSAIAPEDPESKTGPEVKDKLPLQVLNNYFSIGADAKIALDFHSARGKLFVTHPIPSPRLLKSNS